MSSSRQQLPPWDFECAYQRRCPHLHGSSTQWIWEEHKRSHKEHCEHWRVRDILREELEKALAYIGALEEQNEQLKAKLKALHQRQFKSNKNRDQQSSNNSADNCSEQAKKKRGAPKGHPGWFRRKPDHVEKPLLLPLQSYVLIAPVLICRR